MGEPLVIIATASFVWWFTTGLVLYLNRRPRHTFALSLAGSIIILLASLIAAFWIKDDTSIGGAYLGFAAAIGAWAFVELSFYLGFITGPRKHTCAEGCAGWRHFGHALSVSLYHELLIISIMVILAVITAGAENKLVLWVFLTLWVMHESARLNVLLGVRNVSADWVPAHLPFLKSFLKQRPMNAFFPISQAFAIPTLILLIEAAITAHNQSFQFVSMIFLSSLLGLAIIEHWFLVLPIPLSGLWRWWHRNGTETLIDNTEIGLINDDKNGLQSDSSFSYQGNDSRDNPSLSKSHLTKGLNRILTAPGRML